jgi:membrane associated rhomboid family serine protease
MTKKTNGTGNQDDKVVHLPTLAERDRMRKLREKEERESNKTRRSSVPFFNFSKIPPFTGGLLLLFFAVHVYLQFLLSPPALYEVFNSFGFQPAHFSGVKPFTWEALVSPLTHLFIHGSWPHLFFNAISLLVMGMFFEKTFGGKTTAFFFLACGLAGAAVYFALNPFSDTPIIGASGSISGLFGAVTILLFQRSPQARFSKRGPWPMVIFWVLFMTVMGLLGGDAMAWQAHVGGFLAGIGLLHLLQKGTIRFR